MENADLMNNFNINFNEMVTSIDMGNIDQAEITSETDEILKEINFLRDEISKKLMDISTVDTDLEKRENNFLEEFNKLDFEKKELYKKLENEFIVNSHLYIEADKNKVLFKNLNLDFINDNNVGKINLKKI
jgi:hypothetical protein